MSRFLGIRKITRSNQVFGYFSDYMFPATTNSGWKLPQTASQTTGLRTGKHVGLEHNGAERRESLRVAVVEDDAVLREQVFVPGLVDHGYEVIGVGSAAELYRRMSTESFDVIVLDVSLSDESGFDVARHLRASSSVGIVMLTARGDTRDRLRGLTSGADVYLHKPVEVELLIATLESLARRLNGTSELPSKLVWQMEVEGWRLVAPNDAVVDLSNLERRVLRLLWKAAGKLVTYATIIAELAEGEKEFDPHRLEMIVYRLRRKVFKKTGLKLPLHAIRGQGYVLTVSTNAG